MLSESEFLVADSPHEMIGSLPNGLGAPLQTLRLCLLSAVDAGSGRPTNLTALDVAERYADGDATQQELEAACTDAGKAQRAQRRKDLLLSYAAVHACSGNGNGLAEFTC